MNKDERIERLEEEILAARQTITGLIKAIEEISKKIGSGGTVINYPAYPRYVYPYPQPYRFYDGSWSYTTTTGTVNASNVNTAGFLQIKNGDDDGESGVRAAV